MATKQAQEPHPNPNTGGKKISKDDYKFDADRRGWRGPITKQNADSQMSKKLKDRKKQTVDQSHAETKKNLVGNVSLDVGDDDDDAISVSEVEDVLKEIPAIPRPFSHGKDDSRYASWKTPVRHDPESVQQIFSWDRPTTTEESGSFTSQAQQLKRTEALVLQKRKEIRALKDQLMKSQEENYQLIKEKLKGFTGKQCAEMQEENKSLRKQLDKLVRENMMLRGLQKREGNHVLHKLDYERELEEKYGIPTMKRPSPDSLAGKSPRPDSKNRVPLVSDKNSKDVTPRG